MKDQLISVDYWATNSARRSRPEPDKPGLSRDSEFISVAFILPYLHFSLLLPIKNRAVNEADLKLIQCLPSECFPSVGVISEGLPPPVGGSYQLGRQLQRIKRRLQFSFREWSFGNDRFLLYEAFLLSFSRSLAVRLWMTFNRRCGEGVLRTH